MSSKIDAAAKYLKTHEWARVEGDLIVLGISDHAQEAMGDLVYVELPSIGTTLNAGESLGVVESVKAASDVYAAVGGEVVAINDNLPNAPETINTDPYNAGWMVKVKPSNLDDLNKLMNAEVYAQFLAETEG